jgi:hypothetical protein
MMIRPPIPAGPPPRPKKKAADSSSSPPSDAFLAAVRDRAVERVRNASKGTGHDILRASARLLAGHGFTDREITDWLADAAGEDWSRIPETIAWGIADGRKRPLAESR